MQGLAREIGAPATCFWTRRSETEVEARFFSPRSEYQICGHAVIGLFTLLNQEMPLTGKAVQSLTTPSGTTRVYVAPDPPGSPRIMLDLPLPNFSPVSPLTTALADVLKISLEAFSGGIAPQTAQADFRHLMVNVSSPETLAAIDPSFEDIARFCKSTNHDSLAVFALGPGKVLRNYHVREFCPVIGVDESAAGGTTNASLSYLLAKEGKLRFQDDGSAHCIAHQGASIGRPSEIHCEVLETGGQISAVRAGGYAVETSGFS